MVDLLVIATPFLALAASLCVIYAIRYLDVVEREPKRIIVAALLFGALATIPAIIAQHLGHSLWQSISGNEEIAGTLGTVIDAPISEEIFKGVALLALLAINRKKFDSLTDHVVYACAIGIGFELIENILYQWSSVEDPRPVASWIDEFNGRVVASAGSHAFFSAWLGLAAWMVNQSKASGRWLWALACVAISILLHAANNFAAVLTQLGPPEEVIPVNRVGASLGVVSDHFTLALFIGLIGVAVLRDLRFLSDFGVLVQSRLQRDLTVEGGKSLNRLQDLLNPVNHVLASSGWSWRLAGGIAQPCSERSTYRSFARLALASAKRGPEETAEILARSSLVEEGVNLARGIA